MNMNRYKICKLVVDGSLFLLLSNPYNIIQLFASYKALLITGLRRDCRSLESLLLP